jgi:hypothetical protein
MAARENPAGRTAADRANEAWFGIGGMEITDA